MKSLDEFIAEQERIDPEFAAAKEEFQPEAALMSALCQARREQNLTQEELSKRSGIAQTEISRIERGTRNPSIKTLQRLAEGMGMYLHISFIPKEQSSAQSAIS